MTFPAVRAVGLSQAYGSLVALHPLNLELQLGERMAVLGDNGAGKTSLLRMLATAAHPEHGTLQLLGLEASAHRQELRRRIGYLAHQPGLYPQLSARENLDFFCALYSLPRARAGELLDLVELGPHRDRPAGELSRGLQQRLAIARSLLHDPDLWILDEPDASLDELGRRLLRQFVKSRSVVLATHDRTLAAELCPRTLVLSDGWAAEVGERRLQVVEGS